MRRFPAAVRRAMRAAQAAVTCIPVQIDDGEWQAALFFQLSGAESQRDRRVLASTRQALPVAFDCDLLAHRHAAVVMLRVEVYTKATDPLAGEVLLLPGHFKLHFEVLRLLSKQMRLCYFFGDPRFRVIHGQQQPLDSDQRQVVETVLSDALRHDSLIRCSGRYDAHAALTDIVANYRQRSTESAVQA